MANAEVVVVGQDELALVADLHNQVFRPPRTAEQLRRRFLGRYNPMILVAQLDGRPVGFATGFELKPTVFFSWLMGVVPEARRMGVASQIVDAMFSWAREHDYRYVRMECHNSARPILHMAIKQGFNIVGIRWDGDHADNLVIFEAALADLPESE